MPVNTLGSLRASVAARWQGQGHKLGDTSSSTATTTTTAITTATTTATTAATETLKEQEDNQNNAPQTGSAPRTKSVVQKITAEGKRVNSVAPTGAVVTFGNVTLGSAKYKPDARNGAKAESNICDFQITEISSKFDAAGSFAPVGFNIAMGDIAIETQPQPNQVSNRHK